MITNLPLTSPEEAALYRKKGLWRDVTMTELFFKAADRFPDKPAVIEQNRTLTYKEMRERVENIASNLLDLGLKAGDIVAMQYINSAEFPLVHFACNRIGLLYMPLHDTWREIEVAHLLKLAKVKALIVPHIYRDFNHAKMVKEIQGQLPDLKHVFTIGGAAEGYRDFAELFAPAKHSSAELDKHRPDPDLPGHCMLSGGTTALSKISRFSSNDLIAMLDQSAVTGEFDDKAVTAAIAPAGTGATGYIFPILMPLLHGATSVILERWGDPEVAVNLIKNNHCTHATGIPTQLTRMVPYLEKCKPSDFESFRCFTNAGAPLPYETAVKIEDLMGCAIQSIYGATDGGTPTMGSLSDPREKRLTTVGRAVATAECEIRDPSGKALPPGEAGEVVWRAADKSYGYLGDDAQTKAAFTEDRFYKSGDLGQFDEQGYLRIVGRIKDMILRGGRNISPRLIEEFLIKHPSVVDVAVAPMPDPVLGERACAFVILKPGTSLSFEEAVSFLKDQKLAVFQLPERLEVLDDLPKGVGGKVTKKDLTAMVTAKLKAEGKL